VKELEAKGKVVDKVSMLGYSLGGLISRYAIGVLGEDGFFDRYKPMVGHNSMTKGKGPYADMY
jgi:triacylglycerol esterase/lipase EstA (alpha/beta hydrolase family)